MLSLSHSQRVTLIARAAMRRRSCSRTGTWLNLSAKIDAPPCLYDV